MAKCPHCKRTIPAPIKLPQECVGCQKRIIVTFESLADVAENSGFVYCTECKKPKA